MLALLGAGCGGDDGGVEVLSAGDGARGAEVLLPEDASEPLPAVIFLHGWGATDPRLYRPWLDHLVAQGNAVIYPRYQRNLLSDPDEVLENALAGVRAALDEVAVEPGSVVVAGHSAGGALAGDYAAVAESVGLPPAQAVFSVYPGRRRYGSPATIPSTDPERIPPETRILALRGADDRVVADDAAAELVQGAARVPRERRRLIEVDDPAVDDHGAPLREDAPARRAFWRRLDALIAAARR